MASLIYDEILLEGGTAQVQAGPSGSISMIVPTTQPARWQTAAQRNAAAGHDFVFMIGSESQPGVPAGPMVPFISSETSFRWEATLEPFASELPTKCDWIEFVAAPLMAPGLRDLAKQWKAKDKANGVLSAELPVDFVRNRVVDDTNDDLALVLGAGAALTADRLHGAVLEARIADETGWGLQGFAIPILVPQVGDLDWETIGELRRDRNLEALRRTWHELEDECIAEALGGGDVERMLRTKYEARLRVAAENASGSLGRVAGDLGVGLLLSSGGWAAGAVLGPAGQLAGFAGPTLITGGIEARRYLGRRSAGRWITMDTRIRQLTSG
jgi:hypothetical protein